MKHILPFKKDINYKIDIFTINEANKFYHEFINRNNYITDDEDGYSRYNYNLKDKIHYFDENDFNSSWSSTEYDKTCRLFIAHNAKDMLGIGKFAYWGSSKSYAISYVSTNKEFFKLGVSKKILDKIFEYFSKKYKNETMNFSGYSIDGWKYLRNSILELSKKYNVKIIEKGIQYPGPSGRFTDDEYKLMHNSREEIKKLYGDNYYN